MNLPVRHFFTGFWLVICSIGGLSSVLAGQVVESAAPGGHTLFGTPLREPAWSPESRARLLEDLAIAQAQFDVAPQREDSFIWLGRRLGYLARWEEAIDVFTRGLEVHPGSYKLYRFRGRHLARSRQLDRAIDDYRQAADLVESKTDSFEPDGIVNARHQYLGTYKSNIHYYLAQTSYATGDYDTAVTGMQRAISEPLGYSPDRLVSTAYWRYLGLRKLGRHDEAKAAVDAVSTDLDIIENHTYYKSVLFFNGTYTAEALLPEADSLIRFAIAMNHHFDGDQDLAIEMWREIVTGSTQGFWPAEAELVFANEGLE